MYCNMTMYSPLPAAQIFQNAFSGPSSNLLPIISKALVFNFQQFCQAKVMQEYSQSKGAPKKAHQLKNEEPIIIDLLSEEQEFEENFIEQINGQNQISNIGENEMKQSRLEVNQGSHQVEKTIVSVENGQQSPLKAKDQQTKQNQNHNSTVLFENEEGDLGMDEEFVEFEAQCPKLWMEFSELHRRKQSLLRRQVNNWNEVPNKSRKQRREVRLLQN